MLQLRLLQYQQLAGQETSCSCTTIVHRFEQQLDISLCAARMTLLLTNITDLYTLMRSQDHTTRGIAPAKLLIPLAPKGAYAGH